MYVPFICPDLAVLGQNSHPPAPRLFTTWNTDDVLAYLASLPINSELSFQILAHKLVMLMALSNADRCSYLAALDLNFEQHCSNGVVVTISGSTKSRKCWPPILPVFASDPKLCSVETLKEYIERSKAMCQPNQPDLFVSIRKPYNPVKAVTIGH